MYTIAQTYIAAILVMQENRHKKIKEAWEYLWVLKKMGKDKNRTCLAELNPRISWFPSRTTFLHGAPKALKNVCLDGPNLLYTECWTWNTLLSFDWVRLLFSNGSITVEFMHSIHAYWGSIYCLLALGH